MSLGKPVDAEALLLEMRGETGRYSPLNPNVLIVPALGRRKEPFEPEPVTDRDTILRTALAYLEGRGVEYVPLAIEEDIQASYEDDTYDEFRATVRGWVRELVRASKKGVT